MILNYLLYNMNNEMVKCGIVNNCINDSLIYYSKLEKHRKKIIQNLLSLRKITDKQLNDLKIAYKEFSKHFFSKKTIKCMREYCNPKSTDYKKMEKTMDELKGKIIATKTKMALFGKNKNYVKLMDVMFVVLGHFSKNYKKFFTK
jgi:hypothetical protein